MAVQWQTGTCSLCGQEMIRDPEDGDVWHPYTVERECPPSPDMTDFEGWRQFTAKGLRIGRPGVEYFVPDKS